MEVGAGTGPQVVAVEPSSAMRARMTRRLEKSQAPVGNVDGVAERLPMPDGIADTVVASLDLRSVGDLDAALAEIRRVLIPEGEFAVLEHVRAIGWRCHRQETVRHRCASWRWLQPQPPDRGGHRAGFGLDHLERLLLRPDVRVTVPLILGRGRLEAMRGPCR
ncbi:MAG: class I SAM-dependent methyltransferase [Acidimicrobiales bacterium]